MQAEMNIKVIELPEGKDPDECIKQDPQAWTKAVATAKEAMQYYFDQALTDLDLTMVSDRREAARILLPIIAQLGNKIEQDAWLKKLSETIDIKEDILRETITKLGPIRSYQAAESPKPTKARPRSLTRAEKMSEILLALLIKFPFLLEYALHHLQIDQVVGKEANLLYRNLIFYYNNIINNVSAPKEQVINYNDFKEWLASRDKQALDDNTKDNQLKLLNKLVFLGERDFYNAEKGQAKNEIIKIVLFLKKHQLAGRMKEIEKQIGAAEKDGDESQIKELMEEFKVLSDELREMDKG
jgi:DNA primase